MIRILTVIGARPQFVKSAVFSYSIQKNSLFEEIIVHTGQHYDDKMSAIFYRELHLPNPHYILDSGGLGHGAMTGRLIEQIERICLETKPMLILVYGDTNSTLAAAIAGSKLHIPIAHVEAGLRSFNMSMPEEINRILTDRVSSLLFCPTETAVRNLEAEGYNNYGSKILNSGDVMFDMIRLTSKIFPSLEQSRANYILATIHRAENTNNIDKLRDIFNAINYISDTIKFKIPLHPRTRNFITENQIRIGDNIEILEPVGYFEMMSLLKGCDYVMSDSGGLQKEAYFMEKNCIILRDETEWVELVENGNNVLVGTKFKDIIGASKEVVNLNKDFSSQFYGNGQSVDIITSAIAKYFLS